MVSSLKEEYATVLELGADILAISADSLDSHMSFCKEMGGCPFPLASDADHEVARMYDAIDGDGHALRAVYVLDEDLTVIHMIPWYQPGNVGQFMEIFHALGLE